MQVYSLCILMFALMMMSTPTWGQETSDKDTARIQVRLSSIATAEAYYFALYHRYTKLDRLIDMGWLDSSEVVCELALSSDRQRFVVVAKADNDTTWSIDKRQELDCIVTTATISPQELLDDYRDLSPSDVYSFFRQQEETPKIMVALIKKGVHRVQLDVERYAVDHQGEYPESLDVLVEQGYAEPGFYTNPCTATRYDQLNAQNHPEEWSAGDFGYVPNKVDGKVTSYRILGYGPDRTGGTRQDGVIIILSSGTDVS